MFCSAILVHVFYRINSVAGAQLDIIVGCILSLLLSMCLVSELNRSTQLYYNLLFIDRLKLTRIAQM